MQNQYVLRDVATPHIRPAVQETSDEARIGLIADGDKRAMQVLYARHNVRVYRFIVRLTGNQSLAEDLVS
ncbi:MAG: polymerase sigma-70 factor, subfamily, partial [Alphaproteobacteria bacterium]|nr:polymerase sigma-70 factor, subfamily [Alphaproteobacteria bacterium]